MDHFLWVVIFVLVVSFLSNASPFVGASYTLLTTLQLSLLGFTPFNFATLVFLSAVGATLAKVVIYYGAFGARGLLLKNRNVRLIGRSSTSDRFYLALFVSALVPIFPLDDFIYIGAGATSVSLGLMAVVTLAAKIVKSGVEIVLEFAVLSDLSGLFGGHQVELTVALTALFIAIGIVAYRVDWEGLYRKYWRRESAPQAADKPL